MPNQEGIVCAIFKPAEAWWREGKEGKVDGNGWGADQSSLSDTGLDKRGTLRSWRCTCLIDTVFIHSTLELK